MSAGSVVTLPGDDTTEAFLAALGGEDFQKLRRGAARLVVALRVRFEGGRVLLVDHDHRRPGAEALALRLREVDERLVDEDHGRETYLPGCKSVAHGGAGTGPSGADADHQVVDL